MFAVCLWQVPRSLAKQQVPEGPNAIFFATPQTPLFISLRVHRRPSLVKMFEAADHARSGDVAYFRGLTPSELTSLIVGRDEDGRTLFHTAAANGHLELLELLAGSGAAKVANKQDDEVRHVQLQCPAHATVFGSQHTQQLALGVHMTVVRCCSRIPRCQATCVEAVLLVLNLVILCCLLLPGLDSPAFCCELGPGKDCSSSITVWCQSRRPEQWGTDSSALCGAQLWLQ